jgi:hypothetical protein
MTLLESSGSRGRPGNDSAGVDLVLSSQHHPLPDARHPDDEAGPQLRPVVLQLLDVALHPAPAGMSCLHAVCQTVHLHFYMADCMHAPHSVTIH